jgi:hypothetical protein
VRVNATDKGEPMTTTSSTFNTQAAATTPTDRLLTGALLVAPLIYLAADTTYAARGWDDGTGGLLHVVGAIAYGFVVLRVAAWLPRESRLAASILLAGLIGMVGNAAYGFEAIHMSLGDTQLVDQPGAANLIKPLGLCFPVSLALIAWALVRLGDRWQGTLVLFASLAWPVAHIGNLPVVAVPTDIALVIAFGSLVWARRGASSDAGDLTPRIRTAP